MAKVTLGRRTYKRNWDGHRCGKSFMIRERVEGKLIFRYRWVSCKRWGCWFCGPRKKRELIAAISVQAAAWNLKYFVTLTFNPKRPLDAVGIRNATKTFQHFMKVVTRYLGRRPLYIRTLDLHQSGELHIHALLDECPDLLWLRRNWGKKPHGTDIHVRAASFESDPGYMAKNVLSLPSGAHPCRTSELIKLFPKREKKVGARWTPVPIRKLRRMVGGRVLEERFARNGLLCEFVTDREIRLDGHVRQGGRPESKKPIDREPWKKPQAPDELRTAKASPVKNVMRLGLPMESRACRGLKVATDAARAYGSPLACGDRHSEPPSLHWGDDKAKTSGRRRPPPRGHCKTGLRGLIVPVWSVIRRAARFVNNTPSWWRVWLPYKHR